MMWSSRLELRQQGRQRKNDRDVLTDDGQSRRVEYMRRVAIILGAALWLASPAISHAQYNDTDQQNPKEYHDEDSQPLALFADFLYPIGYGLEWLVSRPMHWVANDSPVAPVYRPVGGSDMSPPPPVPIIPDNTMDQATTSTAPQDWSPTRAPVTMNATLIKPAAPASSAPPASNSQPALH
ncbi:MAG TPA: hypothetical protein VJX68_01670 [Candidatus Binatus sp.]|uniref:hypothetical protein n=1 Tax=Candidatus Binatus sp. TaxID=2811406 RepID=UPI002B48E3AF|nr:hypothetical protein [Candidatus Binatus sp.]HKN11879.1 hypothetical protein [Candidatus Binatus sp.]